MHEASALITLAGIHFIALMSPGPDVALVVQNSAKYGRQTGLYIAFGLSAGIFFHSLLCLTGVSYLVHQQPVLFAILQLFGGSYLGYLGIGALKDILFQWHQKEKVSSDEPTLLLFNKRQAFSRGFMTNILNPKALVFFVSLMSALIPAGMSLFSKGCALLILWGLALLWFAALSWILSTQKMQLKLQAVSRYIDLLCGIIFSLIGGGILYQSAAGLLS
ncbi:LysE family translocator [Vibrio salinus]|uniref:LysE family translocator n=1 Tax=Vibrio salinus TaxID=2899784 RepID=UPI001E62D668|nr:LysE family translocator [Vibrio salinus]MCE0495052.1 LysE family translocator [Vibrio salinus]